MKKLLLVFGLLFSLGFCVDITVDSFRVIRSGNLIKTTTPIIYITSANIVVPTSSATLTTGNVNIIVKDVSGNVYYIKANTGA